VVALEGIGVRFSPQAGAAPGALPKLAPPQQVPHPRGGYDARSERNGKQVSLARHTAYNLAGQILPLALSLLTIPIYLRLVGEARFGVLALLWLFFGYMGLFDLGMGQATARQLSRSDQVTSPEQAQVLWTALLISLGLGMVGALVAEPVGVWYFGHHASVGDELRGELLAALPWAALLVPATTLAGVLTGALQARSAFAEINVIGVLTNALVLLAPLSVAAAIGAGLPGLVAAVVAARLFVLLLLFWRCRRHYLASAPVSVNRHAASGLLSFGGWATISAGVGPLMVVLDRFVIGVQLGAKAVSHYVVPFQLAERTSTLSSALTYALFPRLAGSASESERQQLSMRCLRALAVWTSPLIAIAILLSGPFLAWWISPELAAQSTVVAQVLCLGFWINSLAMVPYTKLLASGRPDVVAKIHLVELLPYLLLLWVALQAWGLVGAAVAFSVRVAIDFLLLSHLADMLMPTLRLLAFPAALLCVMLGVAGFADLAASWRWVLGLGLSVALSTWSLALASTRFPECDVRTS
jgi:O-antigen/teichoic acid export membrane protein